jgi:fermentation-respiration switch protein FrsA (DUF1100 family)
MLAASTGVTWLWLSGSRASDRLPNVRAIDELLLFFPSRHPEGDWQPADLRFEDVWFTADDGVRLHGWLCACPNPRAIVLYAHGNAGNISHRAPLLKQLQDQLRVSTLMFDYRGYGRSAGSPSVTGVLKDVRAARKFLAEKTKVPETQLVLMGESLGGALVTHVAAEAPARALILESTFSSLKEVAEFHYGKLSWFVADGKLNSASQIGRYRGPLLQSHGDADRIIPFRLGRRLFDAANEPKTFITIAGGDHNDPPSLDYYQRLDEFIGSLP